MRKLVMSLTVLGGILLAGTGPASANVATGLTAAHIDKTNGIVQKTGWHRRGFRHAGFYFGFGVPYWGVYPAYPYYDDYWYPSYGYYYYPRWRHHRHWRHRHWRHRHWRHHRHHRHHRRHHRHH